MASLKSYIDSGLTVWQQSTPAARIAIGLLTILCVAVVGGVGYWSAMPSYVNLVSDVDHQTMAKLVDELEKAGIRYEMGGAGGVLRVDKRDFARARMLARESGVTADGATTDATMGGLWLDPVDRKNIETRKKEQSLIATLRKFKAIRDADVHLNVPIRGPFERKASPPTASVLLTLVPGERLTEQQASSIASLVAFAVQDLEPEQVNITDKDGHEYMIHDELAASINSQIDFITEAERKLARKAEDQLMRVLGPGNASVQVSLDLTFLNGSKTVTKYDAKGRVATKENLDSKTTTKDERSALGAAGTSSNLRPSGGGAGSKPEVVQKSEVIATDYLVPETKEVETNTTPIRNFMTVSVLVNSGASSVQQEDGTLIANINTQLTDIVKTAVGFQEGKDTISLEFLTFPEIMEEAPTAAPVNWTQINEIIRNASLALAAIVAMLLGFLTLRRFRPVTAPVEPLPLETDRLASFSKLADLAKQDPTAFGQILRGWVESPEQYTTQSSDSTTRRAA